MDSLLLAGLNNAAWAAALALGVAVIGKVWHRRPAFIHALWLLVLVKLVTPSFVRIDPSHWFSGPEPMPSITAPVAESPVETIEGSNWRTRDVSPLSSIQSGRQRADDPRSPRTDARPRMWRWRETLGMTWLAGSMLWGSAVALGVLRFRRLIRSAQPASDELRDQIERMAARFRLRRVPTTFVVSARVPPMLWALVGPPRLILPQELWNNLSDPERDAILAHELAHLKRRDEWARRLEAVALGLYWWNPVAWWVRREVERTEEQCCDAWVLWALPGAGSAYARALVLTADFLSQSKSRHSWPAGASGAGHFPPLKRRLTMILEHSAKGVNPSPRFGSRLVLILAGVSLLFLPAWALSEPPQTKDLKKPPEISKANTKTTATPKPVAKAPVLDVPPDIAGKVKFAQVTTGEVSDYQQFMGTLAIAEAATVIAPRAGTVKSLHPSGTIVEKDEPIFEYIATNPSENPNPRVKSPARGIFYPDEKFSEYGKNQMLAYIMPIDLILVDFHIDQGTFLRLRRQKIATGKKSALDLGFPVEVLVGGDSGRYQGQMIAVEKTFNPKSHTLHCRASMPNPDGLFIPGMLASVEFPIGVPREALILPAETEIMSGMGGLGGSQMMLVMNDQNLIEARFVIFERRYSGKYEVKDGLKEGDWVVIAGQKLVKSGMKVKR